MPEGFSVSQLIACLDLTRLEAVSGDEAAVDALCDRAVTALGPVAAVCVHPAYVARAARRLRGSGVALATVIDFPEGAGHTADALAQIDAALADGTDEIDLVVPWRRWLAGEHAAVRQHLETAVRACAGKPLKAIIETGAIPDAGDRRALAQAAAQAGASFLKTSTGKTPVGATPEGVAALLEAIADAPTPRPGLKVAGGVRSPAQARAYAAQAAARFGAEFVAARHFRLGASGLLDALLEEAGAAA